MKRKFHALMILATVLMAASAGCQTGRVFYQPTALASVKPLTRYDVVLAVDFVQPTDVQTPPDENPADQKVSDEVRKDEPATTDQPATTKPAYTVPASQYQQLALLTVGIAAFGTSDVEGMGKEASESQVMASLGVVGRPGLSAPPPRVRSAVVGRPGLQQGFALGLGPASNRNIFTSRLNPASGTNGRCQELISAGFFNRDRAMCEASFRR